MTGPLTFEQRSAFYRAAVLGLRALDARETTARRFGPDAEARWAQFAGALGLRSAGFAHLDDAVVSPDAEPEAAELARKVGGK